MHASQSTVEEKPEDEDAVVEAEQAADHLFRLRIAALAGMAVDEPAVLVE